jgi:hypothetical protein
MVSGVSPAAGVVKASLNKNETNEHPTSVRTWLWFVIERDTEALPGKA